MLEQRSAPAGAEKKYTSPFVFDDVRGPANWREGISAPVPTKHTDLLALQYPRYATQLNEARGEGYTDEEILQFLGGREAEALLYYPIQEVNSYLGRTGKTMQEAAQTHWDSQRAAYAKITGKSEEDVEERMKAGQLIGVPASTLLIDDALYEKLTPHIKKTEAWTETLANGVRLENVQRQISDIGYQLMMFQNVPDWEKQVEALEAQQRALQPALRTGGLVRAAQGAIKMAAQMGNTGLRALPYAGAGALVGGLTGQALGGTVLTPTGLATGAGGAMTGFATGMAFGSTLEMFKMEAGSAYLDLIRTKDKDGRGMDPTLARGAAVCVGLINAALENLQLRTVVENIPGGTAVLAALKGSGAKRLMNVPTIRGVLLKLAEEKFEAVSENTFQEIAQEFVPIVIGELAKVISGREFEHVSVEEAVNQILTVGKETVQSTSLLFVPGAVTQGIGMVRDVQQAKSGADVATGATEATSEASAPAPEGEAVVQGQPADGLGKNAEAGAEEAETNVYLPVAALEQYAQTHPGELEDLGVDLTPLEGMDEVRMTEAQFASLSEELPELAEAVRNDVRRGAKGATAREAGEIVLRRASRPAWRTAETDAVAEELERKMLAVGKDREEARVFARVGASVAGMLARRANISPADAMRLTLRRGKDARQGESFTQPVNAGVDLGQKVPILDLSGAEGTSTTKELLTRLKDMALKDETWISRDAEVFATLPRGKKLKHVAYSSRMPGSREARALRSNIASGLDELVQNAVLIESVPNNDPKKADVLNFHRLYVPVRTDAGIQAVRIVAEELKESDRLRPTDVELYDVVLEGQKESPAVSHGLLAEEVVPSPGAPSEITIADMLRGVKDADGNLYVGEEYRQTRQLSLFGEDGEPTLGALPQQRHFLDRLSEKPVEQWSLDEIVAFEEFEDKFNTDKPSTWGASEEDTKRIKKLRAKEREMEDLDGYEFEDNAPSTWNGTDSETRQRASAIMAKGRDMTPQEYAELRKLQMAAEETYRRDFRRKHIDPDGLLDLYDPQKLEELLYKVSRGTQGKDLTLEDEVTSKGQFQRESPDTGDWVKYPIFIKKRKGERVFEVQDDTGKVCAQFDNEIRARYFARAVAQKLDEAREALRTADDFVPPSQAILDAFDRNDPTTWGNEQLQSQGVELLQKENAADEAGDDSALEKYNGMFYRLVEDAEALLIDRVDREQEAHEDDLENNPFRGLDIATVIAGVDTEPYRQASTPSSVGEVYNQTAYNGSPAIYDKFDMSKVGSGNGTASYGWGAYLSSAHDVAKMYALLAGGDAESTQVAKFDIPEDDVLLDRNKKFSEQPQKVKDALQPYADEYQQSDGERGIKIYDVFSGAQIQEKIADALNEGRISVPGGLSGPVDETSREVSVFLNGLGIPGLRYPDDGGNGYDFVIWDENVMHMLEREVGGRTETFPSTSQSSARQSVSGQQGPREDPGALLRRVWGGSLAYQTREDLEGTIAAIDGGLTIDGFPDDGVGYFLTREALDRMGLERPNRVGYDENDPTTWPEGPRKEEAIKYRALLDEIPLDGDEYEKIEAILDRLRDEEARDAEKEREIYSRLEEWYAGHLNAMKDDAEDRLRYMRLFGVNSLAELYDRMDEAEATPASEWSPELRAFMERFATVTKYYEPFLGRGPEDYAFYEAGNDPGETMEKPTRWRGVPELEELFLDLAEVEKNLAFDDDKEVQKGLRKEKAGIVKEAHAILKRMHKELDALIDEDEARQKALWAKAEEAGIKVEDAQRPETYYQAAYHGSLRQSEDYDSGDPKTWPAGPVRDEALDLLSDIEVLRMGAMHPDTWAHDERRAKEALEIMRRKDRLGDVKQDPHTWTEGSRKEDALAYLETLDEDGEVELDPNTWMEHSPYKQEALEAWKQYTELGEALAKKQELGEPLPQENVDAYNKAEEFLWGLRAQEQERVDERLEALREEEFNAVDEEMDRLDDRYSDLEDKESRAMLAEAEDLQERLNALIEAEEEAAAQEAEEYYQIIGRRGAKALDAAEEGTARLDNLNVAREMEQAGKDVKAIRLATGWERGVDGKWRYEIPDGTFRREGFTSNPDMLEFRELERKFIDGDITEGEQARLKELTPTVRWIRKPSRLSDFYDAPELYAAYPELADISVRFQVMDEGGKGAYSPARNAITLNAGVRDENARITLVHEIQHAIQNIEGFARGGNLDEGGARYHRLAGEAEARNAGRRTLLSDKERKERLLAETEDVAREDQIILEGMMEAYSEQQAEETENIRRGQAAMEKVIAEQTDVMDAMHRDDLGSISFLWGEPGHGAKFKGGWGVSHIIAHRNAQGYDGPAVARKMAEVIAKGEAVNRRGPAGGERVDVVHDGHTAVLSLYKDGEQKTWLLSGWENYKKEAPDVSSEGDGSTGTTLSGPMRARPEEGAGASGNSKPPLPQKSKPESAINAQLTVQSDGMSLIEFFESANRSTSFHELAHHVFRMLDELSRVEGADTQLRADVDEVLRHAGVTREEFDSEDAEVRRQARTQAHEYFAQGFETYIAEGRAPSRALRGVFRRLRAWMIEVYHDVVQALGIELSPEMRDIYARLLATPEEITAETTVQELAVENAAIKEEIKRYQAELRERTEQEQLGYEASDDWSFYEVPEDAEEAVTGWLGQLEEYEFKRNAHEAVQNVARIIRENGGLRFGDFIVQLGEDLARDVRKRWPGLFRNTTDGPQLALDVLTQTLQENGIDLDVQGLVDWLQENVNEVVKKPAPLVEVNADTLNALVEHLGLDGAREYMTDRRRYLTRLQKALQAEYDQDKNNAQVKADLEATYREQREIAESVKALDRTLSAEDIEERGYQEVSLPFAPELLGTESGRPVEEAASHELLMTPEGAFDLGSISGEAAAALGIPDSEIQANVGVLRHAEREHGAQIRNAGYENVQTFMLDVLSNWKDIYEGTGDSLWLVLPKKSKHGAVAAIRLALNQEGIYRVNTLMYVRERSLKNRKLLFAERPSSTVSPGTDTNLTRATPNESGEYAAKGGSSKEQSSSATVPPGKAGVNTMLTLSEAMRHGYAMAEKYSKAAWRQGVKEGRAKGRAAVEARIAALKQKLKERQEVKKEVGKLVKGINHMAGSERIVWSAHKEIKQLLFSYDLKRRSKKTLERRAEIAQWLKDDPELAGALNEKDTVHVGETTLNEMTLDDLRALNERVQQVYDRGAEEYKVWDLERTEQKDTIYTDLRDTLEKRKADLPKVVTGPEDLKKQYKGIRGRLAKAKDWTYAVTLAKDRFFDWFDGGRTIYRGPFVKYFVDMTAAARDESLRHIQERRKWVETRLRKLGFRVSDFARIATTYNGKDYTWSEIQEIYMGLRNEKKAQAILNGNFKDSADPSGDTAYLISLLSEEHKRAAELVAEDHNRNVDRIEAGMIAAYQKGMERETDYTSIHRLERVSSMGLIDAESDEALMNGLSNADVLRRVEDGFMKKRVEMKAENQTPIHLGLWENWHSDVARHEHAAAMASTARNLAGALLTRDPRSGKTLGRMIKERFGDEAWHTLVSFFNDDVMDDTRLAHNVLDGLCSFMAKNMSIAYLAGNLATVLKQTTSIPRFLITAGPHRILVALGDFLIRGPKFLEEVYAMDPQLRERNGSPLLAMIREDPQWGKRMVQRGLDWLLEPISMVDRWVAAIGWKATYDANVKTLGREAAVREAQRAIRLTQQPANAREAARMWRQNGFVRLAMVFTSDAASTFGMTAYDLVQQLRGGKVGKMFMTLTALALTGILTKAANEGLPDDEDDEEEGRNWALEAFTEQAIASIPLVGKEAMVLYDSMRGKYRGTQYSAFMAPVVKLAQTYHLLSKEDSDEEDQRRATWLALEAFSLSGAARIPVTGMRRIVQSMELAEEDGMAAALNLVGIRRRE